MLGLGERADGDDLVLDQVGHSAVGPGDHQAAKRHRSEELLFGSGHIYAVGGVGVHVQVGYPVTNLLDGLPRPWSSGRE